MNSNVTRRNTTERIFLFRMIYIFRRFQHFSQTNEKDQYKYSSDIDVFEIATENIHTYFLCAKYE